MGDNSVNHFLVSLFLCNVNRFIPFEVLQLEVNAESEQHAGHFDLVELGSPVEGCSLQFILQSKSGAFSVKEFNATETAVQGTVVNCSPAILKCEVYKSYHSFQVKVELESVNIELQDVQLAFTGCQMERSLVRVIPAEIISLLR